MNLKPNFKQSDIVKSKQWECFNPNCNEWYPFKFPFPVSLENAQNKTVTFLKKCGLKDAYLIKELEWRIK